MATPSAALSRGGGLMHDSSEKGVSCMKTLADIFLLTLVSLTMFVADLQAQQTTAAYECKGSVFACGILYEITGEGQTCQAAYDDFDKKLADILRKPCPPPGLNSTAGPVNPPIVITPCRCEIPDFRSDACASCKVVFTCTSTTGQVFIWEVESSSSSQGYRAAATQRNRLFRLLGLRSCTQSCCAVPIPSATK